MRGTCVRWALLVVRCHPGADARTWRRGVGAVGTWPLLKSRSWSRTERPNHPVSLAARARWRRAGASLIVRGRTLAAATVHSVVVTPSPDRVCAKWTCSPATEYVSSCTR